MKNFSLFPFRFFFVIGLIVCFGHTTEAQIFKKKPQPTITLDTVKPEMPKKKESDKKKYSDVITDKAITSRGLFHTHQVEGKYFFEIPDSLMNREILIVSRISGFVKNLNFGGAGMSSRPQQVIRFQKLNGKVILRSVSYNSVASNEDPISVSVRNNNFEPVIMAFDVATRSDDSSYVIDIAPLFTSDVPMIGAISTEQRKEFEISALDVPRSLVVSMKSFPKNVEVKHILTYRGNKLPDNQLTGTLSIEMNQSFILLPEVPMRPRLYDSRVSYFSIQQVDYGLEEQKAAKRRFITRWNLVPKDLEAYKRGELSEPVKQIVYYIDPATPLKWRPFLKQGVEDWNVAFEEAGFKNAIVAKDPPSPEEDPDWSPEDVRYSVIRYIATEIQNAQGPHVHDPRTGEIIESDILWYHNVMNLLRNWYFVQTAAVNPKARSVRFEDDVMGELIRFVCAHEVGHTLGLPHNMGSSAAYPVDSLRSATFTATMGTAPSIMDYARFNYVAQPEDRGVALQPKVGPYDKWSIKWGYSYFDDIKSLEEEAIVLNQWIKERAVNPVYRFGQQRGMVLDPRAQSEDLGDDAVLASQYGIKNLNRILDNLILWTSEEAKGYSELQELYGQITAQFNRYIGHVLNNVGGVYEDYKSSDQKEPVYTHTPRMIQKNAVNFINTEVFSTPDWLIRKDILSRIEEAGMVDRIRGIQVGALNNIFSPVRLYRLLEGEYLLGQEAYTLGELHEDIKAQIFSEVRLGLMVDPYRRNLQKAYIDLMINHAGSSDLKIRQSDIPAHSRSQLKMIVAMLKGNMFRQKDQLLKAHYEDLVDRIEKFLDNKS